MAKKNNKQKKEGQQKFFGKLKLNNERSSHVEKLSNNLSGWAFFRYLFANQMFKIVGINLLMLLIASPFIWLILDNTIIANFTASANLPDTNTIGFGSQVWLGFNEFYEEIAVKQGINSSLWMIVAFCVSTLLFSGAFSVIRDSFWTGELKVIKGFFRGILETSYIMLPFMLGLGIAYAGISIFGIWIFAVVGKALAIVIMSLLWVAFVLLACYVMTVYAVVAVFKQPLKVSMKDAYILMNLRMVVNLIVFIASFAPVVLTIMFYNSSAGAFLMSLFIFFGAFYTAYVWIVHLMKIYKVFFPVEVKVVKKKKGVTVVKTSTNTQSNSSEEEEKTKETEQIVSKEEEDNIEKTQPNQPIYKYHTNSSKKKRKK